MISILHPLSKNGLWLQAYFVTHLTWWQFGILSEYPTILILTLILIPNPNSYFIPNPNPNPKPIIIILTLKMIGYSKGQPAIQI